MRSLHAHTEGGAGRRMRYMSLPLIAILVALVQLFDKTRHVCIGNRVNHCRAHVRILCMHVCVRACARVCACEYLRICVSMFVYCLLCMCACMNVCMCACVHMCVYVCMCVFM